MIPVTEAVNSPADDELQESVRLAEPARLTVFWLSEHNKPGTGDTASARLTVPLKLFNEFRVRVAVDVVPDRIVTLVWSRLIAKSSILRVTVTE